MTKPIITVTNGICKMPRWRMKQPVNFTLYDHEHIAIVGRNGSGKSMFVDILTGRHPLFADQIAYDFSDCNSQLASDNIRYIAFRDTYGGDNDRTYFLQQRWNQMEIDAETPTAGQKLEEAYLLAGNDTTERRLHQQRLYDRFGMGELLDKKVVMLSSGELRKLKLLSALFATPRVLIIDNPFIGLDSTMRNHLTTLLEEIASPDISANGSATPCQIVLVLSRAEEIPSFVGTVVEVSDMTVGPRQPLSEYLSTNKAPAAPVLPDDKRQMILQLPTSSATFDSEEVVKMNDVAIRYGNRTILSRLNWTVGKGQRWALSGQNGAGKSTLLSLVCGDNPQAYACDITLFGRSRGSGETIWQIKSHIGYVSPEMHRAYNRPIATMKVVASGLTDSVGLYVRTTEDDCRKCLFWMDIFGIKDKADTLFTELSSGEQRLALLARAFVKAPELLILDEPLHGLDNYNRQLAKDVITTFCQRADKTLIMVTHYNEELPDIITDSLCLKRPEALSETK